MLKRNFRKKEGMKIATYANIFSVVKQTYLKRGTTNLFKGDLK
jgi:hypothetical protein